MLRPIRIAFLLLFFSKLSNAQQPLRPRKTPDPGSVGFQLDSSWSKQLRARKDYEKGLLKKMRDSLLDKLSNGRRSPSGAIHQLTAVNLHPITPGLQSAAILRSRSTALGGCTVKASFTPDNDTTLYTGQGIDFYNTSQNADSYEWTYDGFPWFNNQDGNMTNFFPDVGITQIRLVAHQGSCTDTAISFVVRNGTPPADKHQMVVNYGIPMSDETGSTLVQAKRDGYLLGGESEYDAWGPGSYTNQPYLVRISESGCILWSVLIPGTYRSELHSLVATYDSGFVVDVVQRDDIANSFLLKLDKNGKIVWQRTYQGTDPLNWVSSIKELEDHSLMIMSGQFGAGNFVLTRLDENGGVDWQKRYAFAGNNQAVFSDLVERNGTAWVCGTFFQSQNPVTQKGEWVPLVFKIDATSGNLFWAKGYYGQNSNCSVNGIHFYKDGLILNGFAYAQQDPVNNGWNNLFALQEMDLDGNLRGSKFFSSPDVLNTVFASDITVDGNNNIGAFFSGLETLDLQPGYADYSYYLRLDPNKNILWQKAYGAYTAGYLDHAVSAPDNGLAMLGQRGNFLEQPWSSLSFNMFVLKADSNGVSDDHICNQYNSGLTLMDGDPVAYTPDPPTVTDEPLTVVDKNYQPYRPASGLRYICPNYIPLCSFLKLTGPRTVCNMKDTLEFTLHKDPLCGDPIKWSYDQTNTTTTLRNDGKLRLLFKVPGVYKILVEKPFPCVDIYDSLYVTVAPVLVNLSLGNDTSLCAGDSITLRPGKFDQYRWQDGSVKDSFLAKSAGEYYVQVTDSCGNTRSDTIQVNFKTSIPLDLGADQWICPFDTLTFSPPTGFLKYDWSPDYNMKTFPDGSVMLFPRQDTSYRLVVHDNSSCTGSAGLKINFYPAPQINLGKDTAICEGMQVLFTVPGSFQNYLWNDGETGASLQASKSGAYSVLVQDQHQCRASDTVGLIVYPLPLVSIQGGDRICRDQGQTLDAGAGFESYTWQDGSSQEWLTIRDTGLYRVVVTDLHQCRSADSVWLRTFSETPQQFLPADTIVCSWLGMDIQPNGDFTEYTWSTGETTRSIQVQTAGEYMLEVKSDDGCVGKDSIQVNMKNCEAILALPNAFTPNRDGRNDLFHLKYPGHVNGYEIQIFSRWGQMIYRSKDPYAGWDGTLHGADQPEGSYVWIIRYIDTSGKAQSMKGSVVLVR